MESTRKYAENAIQMVLTTGDGKLNGHEIIVNAMRQSNTAVRQISSQLSGGDPKAIQTTETLFIVNPTANADGTIDAWMGNSGDSRGYIARYNAQLKRYELFAATTDDSIFAKYFRERGFDEVTVRNVIGLMARVKNEHDIVTEIPDYTMQTIALAAWKQRNVITESLGANPNLDPRITDLKLIPNDIVLLFTDGITDVLTDQELTWCINENIRRKGNNNTLMKLIMDTTHDRDAKQNYGRAKPHDQKTVVISTIK